MQWFLSKGRIPFLVLLGAVTLLMAFQCLRLEVDQDNHSMDADNASQAMLEAEFRQVFEEGDSILVAIHRSNILGSEGRGLIRKLVGEFEALDGVQRVTSLVDTDFVVSPHHLGLLISEDESMSTIRLVLGEFSDNGETLAQLVERIGSIADSHADEETRIAVSGLPIQKFEVGRLVRKDQRMFAPLSLLVLGTVLFLITRRLSGMLFPLLVSVLTICWTLGLYAWTGHVLNMITSLLPPVIMTLSVATTIHIYLEWLGSEETDRFKRIAGAVRNLYKPCLFASLTTAIGFLSLLFSSTPAVRDFGVFAAIGVGIAYGLGVAGLAVGLSFMNPPREDGFHGARGWVFLDRLLQTTADVSVNHPWRVILVTLLVACLGVVGLRRIESDTDLLHFLGEDSELVADTEFIDEQLAGVSAIELLVETADGVGLESIDRLVEFEEAIGGLVDVRHVLSIADLLPDVAVKLLDGGASLADVLADFKGNEFLSEDRTRFRLSVCTDVIGTKDGGALVERIRRVADEELGADFLVTPVGGFYRVITESNQLVGSQIRSFGVAILLILLAIGLVFRSFVYTLLAIIPNVVPLLLTAGVMGFSGIALSTGTAMIASVVIGIAVDDTIHYIAAYRRTVVRDRIEAIRYTTRSTGFVLLSTTLALSAGFWVALCGSFQPTIYFAWLAGMTMWFAIVCDLLVLPSILRLASPREANHQHKES
ncbi:efflux RND transporter permease subunit [Haloferula sp.]|uniref:efflux RND transporter permease subunit n=1 Tax=Haloferula sp. TaxID=2497595 RepID=UPI003C7829AA